MSVTTHILHHYQEQARCLFHKSDFLAVILPAPKRFIEMVQDVSYYSHLAPLSRTGKMPVPQRVNFLVGCASCPPLKDLSRMVQDVSYYELFEPFSRTGKMPVPQRVNFLVVWGTARP